MSLGALQGRATTKPVQEDLNPLFNETGLVAKEQSKILVILFALVIERRFLIKIIVIIDSRW